MRGDIEGDKQRGESIVDKIIDKLQHYTAIAPTLLCIALSMYLSFCNNIVFLKFLYNIAITCTIKAQILTMLIVINFCFLSLLCVPYIWRFTIWMLICLSIITNYYMQHYGVTLDRDMMLNVWHTDITEVWELLTWQFFLYVIPQVVLAGLLLFFIRVRFARSFLRGLLSYVVRIIIALVFIIAICVPNSKDVIGFFRTTGLESDIRYKIVPLNIFAANFSLGRAKIKSMTHTRQFHCNEAHVASVVKTKRPVTFIFVVGESARSKNFSINGYSRHTTPLLEQVENVVSIKDVLSCGTATAYSVPCIFSKLSSSEFDVDDNLNVTNLLDVVHRAGFRVQWYENNSSSYGIADRHEFYELRKHKLYDMEFMSILESMKPDMEKQNIFIVLHTIGSHGPAYHERVPEKYRKFVPFCKTSNFLSCTHEEIVNSYDNTIAYLDSFMYNIIKFLKGVNSDAILFYVSDHGESLGENFAYLHGWPKIFAPQEQRHVPIIIWVSSDFLASHQIDMKCVMKVQRDVVGHASHDNVFHTVLGLLRIETQDQKSELNIFKQCIK